MTAEDILKAVSTASGITVSDIKSTKCASSILAARGAYCHLCLKHDLNPYRVGALICKRQPVVKRMAYEYTRAIAKDDELKKMASKAEALLYPESSVSEDTVGETAKWITSGSETYIRIGGTKYSVLDVSSRHFGNMFIAMRNGDILFHRETKMAALLQLNEMLKSAT